MSTGIGETLRAARRQHGRSLADAAAETRVRETYLAALEEEEFGSLGGGVYVKGFLRSYAKFLGLDPEPLLDAYRHEYERADEPMVQQPTGPMGPRERRSGPAVIVVAAGALLLVLAGIGMWLGGGDNGEEQLQDRGPPPVRDEPTPTPEGLTPTPTPTPTPAPDPDVAGIDGIEVVVSVTGTISWMRVQVDDVTTLEGEQEAGFTETFTGEDVVVVRIGDASAVSLEANGQDQGTLGDPNEVVVVTCDAGETECDVEVVA